MTSALFAGLCVVDLVQRVARAPGPDEKVTALSRELVAGGPATNAAVAFAVLGGTATLLTPLGTSGLAEVARVDVERCGVGLVDVVGSDVTFEPNVSSVVVLDGTGERSVVSLDAARVDEPAVRAATEAVLADAVADIVVVDGHYPTVALGVATWARARRIPVVLDAGRWKPHFAELLQLVDEVVASAAFTVPDGTGFGDIAAYSQDRGAAVVAQTHGGGPIEVSVAGRVRSVEVPAVEAVDTLGAGDVLHGAYAYHRAVGRDPEEALQRAADVASFRCRFVGSRTWTRVWPEA